MAKRGRPRINIDQKFFETLCGLQCTLAEIAGAFDCSEDTIENWCKRTYRDDQGNPMIFSDVYKKFSAKGKISLRRYQFQQAEKSTAMAIWLGKQYLGQTEREITVQATGQLADLIDGLKEPPTMTIDTESGEDIEE